MNLGEMQDIENEYNKKENKMNLDEPVEAGPVKVTVDKTKLDKLTAGLKAEYNRHPFFYKCVGAYVGFKVFKKVKTDGLHLTPQRVVDLAASADGKALLVKFNNGAVKAIQVIGPEVDIQA